jgi:hypothetical protein
MHDELSVDTPVITTKPAKESADWTAEARLARRWGLDGKVQEKSDRHGVCYRVKHEDGTEAWYERKELRRKDVLEHTLAERQEMIEKMRVVSERFYGPATMTGVHAFIEFCGLMNEFITVCQSAQERGIDFTMANTHSGQALPFETHHAAYLAEKLNCIYGPALLNNKSVRDTFIAIMFEGEFKLAPVDERPQDRMSPAAAYLDLDGSVDLADERDSA